MSDSANELSMHATLDQALAVIKDLDAIALQEKFETSLNSILNSSPLAEREAQIELIVSWAHLGKRPDPVLMAVGSVTADQLDLIYGDTENIDN